MAAGPAHPEPLLRNGRGHNSERAAYRKEKQNKIKQNKRRSRREGGSFPALDVAVRGCDTNKLTEPLLQLQEGVANLLRMTEQNMERT